jgi:lipopolysaccharide transport system permease protein
MANELEYVIDPSKKRILEIQELWRYKELFYFFTWRDVKVKYKQTFLGVFWVVIQPILTVLIFSLFFGRALQVPSLNLPYPVFVFSGLLFWNLFSSSLNNASNSITSHAPIIKKIYFPRLIIPLSAIIVALLDFLIAFVLFIFLLFYFEINVKPMQIFLLWPAAFVLLLVATVGLSCLLAALSVKYRDFRYVIPFALQVTLFVTPVIYPTSVVGNKWISTLLACNPVYAPIMIFKMPLTHNSPDLKLILISSISAFIFLIAGIYYFKKTEDYFADIA